MTGAQLNLGYFYDTGVGVRNRSTSEWVTPHKRRTRWSIRRPPRATSSNLLEARFGTGSLAANRSRVRCEAAIGATRFTKGVPCPTGGFSVFRLPPKQSPLQSTNEGSDRQHPRRQNHHSGEYSRGVEHPFGLRDQVADPARRAKILADHHGDNRHSATDM